MGPVQTYEDSTCQKMLRELSIGLQLRQSWLQPLAEWEMFTKMAGDIHGYFPAILAKCNWETQDWEYSPVMGQAQPFMIIWKEIIKYWDKGLLQTRDPYILTSNNPRVLTRLERGRFAWENVKTMAMAKWGWVLNALTLALKYAAYPGSSAGYSTNILLIS